MRGELAGGSLRLGDSGLVGNDDEVHAVSCADVVIEMIATALAFGLLVDAVIVRTLLVPALVAIMGHWNWWMPSRLARLLRLPSPTNAEEPAAA